MRREQTCAGIGDGRQDALAEQHVVHNLAHEEIEALSTAGRASISSLQRFERQVCRLALMHADTARVAIGRHYVRGGRGELPYKAAQHTRPVSDPTSNPGHTPSEPPNRQPRTNAQRATQQANQHTRPVSCLRAFGSEGGKRKVLRSGGSKSKVWLGAEAYTCGTISMEWTSHAPARAAIIASRPEPAPMSSTRGGRPCALAKVRTAAVMARSKAALRGASAIIGKWSATTGRRSQVFQQRMV
jgi:hypothetical protein